MKYIHFYISARIIQKNSGNKKGAKKGVQKSRKQRQPRYSYSITVSFFGKKGAKKMR